MTIDFSFWRFAHGAARDVDAELADGITDRLEMSEDVVAFRTALLQRWPELEDCLGPLDRDPGLDPDDLSKYVVVHLHAYQADLIPSIIEVARVHWLVGYDSLAGSPILADPDYP